MRRRLVRTCSVGLLVVGTSCVRLREGADEPEHGVFREGGAIVLTEGALGTGSGSLLSAMLGKVPNLRIRRFSGECPRIALRGGADFQGLTNPAVYVDGTRTTDTCILEMLRATDVERLEVYPQGFTRRPGYGRHGSGLILVFMRGEARPSARTRVSSTYTVELGVRRREPTGVPLNPAPGSPSPRSSGSPPPARA